MSKFNINETFIYRHRYLLGYSLVAIGLLSVLLFAGLFLPGGLSKHEMSSVVISDNIVLADYNSWRLVNLPYYMVQKASINIFGVSILSIKLPSIIFAFFAAVGIVLLLRRWFRPGIGVLSSLIAIFTSQFIFYAQDGTPNIMYIFWAIWLMLLASVIIRKPKHSIFYIIAFYIFAALSLYTPLSIYALLALVCAIIFHPHLRFVVKNIPKAKLAIGIIVAILLISPLAYNIAIEPRLGLDLLGIPTKWPNLFDNLKTISGQYFGFLRPSGSTLTRPFFELGSMMIVVVGIYQVIKDRFTSKNYVIMFWALCIIPIVFINPSFTSVTFMPILLLLATGLNTLLAHWYDLFPRNPYARTAGLIALIVLVSTLIFSGAGRYVYGYTYDPNITPNFSKDLKLIPKKTSNIVVSNSEMAFYKVVAKHNKINVSATPISDEFLSTKAAKQSFNGYTVQTIITSPETNDSDRFYLYKKSTD